ncbi:hypothetical protein IF1G_05056 [Cordyceps javanica]|uniref:Uncharacterized protein n=1 Tax=Cordyceps javanica TaxID=43265 RepID=A0A545V434_9HYPO|nr:hypothetical protein IF1G_05056 [Cordyceps javanica]
MVIMAMTMIMTAQSNPVCRSSRCIVYWIQTPCQWLTKAGGNWQRRAASSKQTVTA